MKILVAPATYKDCLRANEVAELMKNAILQELPAAEIQLMPLADGGEGTVEILTKALKGHIEIVVAHDPLLRKIQTRIGVVNDIKTAIIEMAAVSGIELLDIQERNPFITSTFGTGELIKAALDLGCKKIILGIGGTATNDAGVGALMALGVKFYNKTGNLLGHIGAELSKIENFDLSEFEPRLADTEILIACDVNNPLTGPEGASLIFSPQKGANTEMTLLLEKHLRHFASLIRKYLNKDVENIPGSGAAGGFGGGLMAFTNAKLLPGFEIIRKITRLENYIQLADIVITGEGRLDSTTIRGKAPAGVASIAKQYNKPVIAIAGSLGENYKSLYKTGFTSIYAIADEPMSIEESIKRAPELIQHRVRKIIKTLPIEYK